MEENDKKGCSCNKEDLRKLRKSIATFNSLVASEVPSMQKSLRESTYDLGRSMGFLSNDLDSIKKSIDQSNMRVDYIMNLLSKRVEDATKETA